MSNVVGLRGTSIPIGGVDEKTKAEIIALCEKWLAMANRGEMTAVGFCSVNSEGHVGTGWYRGPHQSFLLAGAVNMLNHRIVVDVLASAIE